MIVATCTAAQLAERWASAKEMRGEFIPTPMMRAILFAEDIATAANKLGQDGHGVERVEFILWRDPPAMEEKIQVNVVPKFRLKQPS